MLSSVCFAAGALIRTDRGDRAVETLAVGDFVTTSSGAKRPIKWRGHRVVKCGNHPNAQAVRPIRIAEHALGPNRPSRALYGSPGHCICVDLLGEVLIPAYALVNGSTVTQVECDEVTYWHIELDSHDIIFANDLTAESYLEMGNREFFAESSVIGMAATPDASTLDVGDLCRPRHENDSVCDAVRHRMRSQAEDLGWTLSSSLELYLEVEGKRIAPMVRGRTCSFMVPAGSRDVWLTSPTARPIDIGNSQDCRTLGVSVGRLAVYNGFQERNVSLDDPLLHAGFYPLEDGKRRWTDDRARLPAALFADCKDGFFLSVELEQDPIGRWVAPERVAASRAA